MPPFSTSEKLMMYNIRRLDLSMIWPLFLAVGWSYGAMWELKKQFWYYATLAGLGFWFVYRLFTLAESVRAYNLGIATELGFTPEELRGVGLA